MITDLLVQTIASDFYSLSHYQTYKGWFYIIITSIALYFLIKRHDEELQDFRKETNIYNEFIDKLFDRIPAMITVYDPKLNSFRVNREFEKVIGWSTEDVNEIDLLKACYPNPELRKDVIKFMNNPETGWKEFNTVTKDGEEVISSWTNIRLSDETQIGIGIDLRELKKSEAELRESEQLLEKIFESLEESVILVEPETRKIVECNKATERIFGYSKSELTGNTTEMLHINKEKFDEFDRIGHKELNEKRSFQTEFKLIRKNGEIFDSDHTVTFVYDEAGETLVAVSVVRDITKQKEYERQLKTSLNEKETLLQEVHHRVKNNLALVVSFLWLQREKLDDHDLKDMLAENIMRVKSIALIHEILYNSELLSEIEVETYFGELIDAIQDTIDSVIDVSIKLECDGITLNVNQAVPCALILSELVSNSLKHAFTNQDEGTIVITVNEVENKIHASVSDNGKGIPEDFGEEDYSMGYNIIHSLISQLDAEVNVKSSEGMTVSFSFPKKEVRGATSSLI